MFILAPNYPAGTDSLNGFKRYYKGELVGEVYTKLGQTDYAAEIAQIRASGADSVFFFLPGGMGIAFMKQYSQSGVGIPVMGPGFSFSQDVLGAIGDAALGAKNTASWSPDLDNARNKEFVAAFKAEYNRLPSIYAAQAFDTGSLIVAAAAKASVKDADAFRAALADGRVRFGARQVQVQHQPPPDPGFLCPRGGQGRRRRAYQQDHRHQLHRPQRRLRQGLQAVGSGFRRIGKPGRRIAAPRRGAASAGSAIASSPATRRYRQIVQTALVIEQLLNGLQFGVMLFLMAAGLTLIFGVMGLINLAHGSFYMIGAFACAAVAAATGSFWLGLVASLAAAAAAGALVEITVIRRLYGRDHLDQVLATFALILIFSEGTRWLFGSFPALPQHPAAARGRRRTARRRALSGLSPGHHRCRHARWRRPLLAHRQDAARHAHPGGRIRPRDDRRARCRHPHALHVVFALGAALAGLAGAMVGALQSVQVGMGEPVLILAFVVIVIGGIGSIKGAFVGASWSASSTRWAHAAAACSPPRSGRPAAGIGAALASMSIYIVMALILAFRPKGLLSVQG